MTANRWAGVLRELGHRVTIAERWDGEGCEVLVALHARKSHPSVARWAFRNPGAPLVVALTGTDLYGDLAKSAAARKSVDLADRLVVLQPHGIRELPRRVRDRTHVIYQSAPRPSRRPPRRPDVFEVCVLGHLRPVKDPLRAALASRRLPASSRVFVHQVGAALTDSLGARAVREEERNPRYAWWGEVPRPRALRMLARSRLLVLTSKAEGGANVVTEALAAGVPVISSAIPGSRGLLGDDYPGFFPVGDTERLAALLHRAETDRGFYRDLARRCRSRASLASPAGERRRWKRLLRELPG